MSMHNDPFMPETVDEQIDFYTQIDSEGLDLSSPNKRIIQKLRGSYKQEYASDQVSRSLDRIWECFRDHIAKDSLSTEYTMKFNHHQDTVLNLPSPMHPAFRRYTTRHRWAIGLAVAVVILNVFGWFLLTQSIHISSPASRRPATATTTPASLLQLKQEAYNRLVAFQQEVTSWGDIHYFHDTYNGKTYALDYEYGHQGIGDDVDTTVQRAKTIADYQAAIKLIQDDMISLKAMEADANDKTPWNRVHATDIQLMQSYQLTRGRVIVVSLIEQSMRVYQNGKLIKAFLITSGRYESPSLPGLWSILARFSPTIFKSSEPKGSAFWFPDTRINYAMEYHQGGYFLNDSWWRTDYGVGTNFPHHDSGGDETFAGNGSLGNIELAENNAAWLYGHTDVGASVLVY